MCQQCSASTASPLISHRPASQLPLRHIRPGLCVHLPSRVLTTAGTREAVLLCLFRVMVSGHYDISFDVIPSQHLRHRRAVSVCVSSPGSTHTSPVPMCQQCSASTASVLISHRPASQLPLRHIRPGLCVHLHSRVSTTAGTRRLSFCASFASWSAGIMTSVSLLSFHSTHGTEGQSPCASHPRNRSLCAEGHVRFKQRKPTGKAVGFLYNCVIN